MQGAKTIPSTLPTGTITFLFSDIEGSTRLWEEAPEETFRALARHDQIVGETIAGHGGFVHKPRGEGDSQFAVFVQASDAAAAAVSIQKQFFAEVWPTPRPVQVRIALHTGEANLRLGDYYGSEVNRCARLRSIGHGGQVLLSGVTGSLVERSLPDGVALRDEGEHRLKDLRKPEHVFQIMIDGLPSDFPALKSLSATLSNIPASSTPFYRPAGGVIGAQSLAVGQRSAAGDAGRTGRYRKNAPGLGSSRRVTRVL